MTRHIPATDDPILSSRYRLILTLLVSLSTGSLSAQNIDHTVNALKSPVTATERLNIAEIENTLGTLLESTRSTHEQTQSVPADAKIDTPLQRRLAPTQPNPETVITKSASSTIAPAIEMSDIRNRIQLLKRLRQHTADAESRDIEKHTEIPMQTQSNAAKFQTSASPSTTPAPSQPTLSAIQRNLQPADNSAKETSQHVEPTMQATQILSSPVDAMRLSESLYRTKNYAAALAALQKVNVDTLSKSDRAWRDLLTALSQKRLGDIESSDAKLRDLANEASSDYSISIARWWLKHNKHRQDAKPAMDQYSTEINTLIERSKQHATP